MDPLLSIQLYHQPDMYKPGDVMRCDYQIDAVDAAAVSSVEASIVWFSEGKGDEDMGVHFFERRVPTDVDHGDLRPLHTFEDTLPNSPLSYHGELVQVRWCVRVRVFLKNGKEYCAEKPFVLAPRHAPNPVRVVPHEV